MTTIHLIVRYSMFAVLAILANLVTQRIVLNFWEGTQGFVLAVGAGTAVGLILKYFLDKRWIFYDTTTGLGIHGRKMTLYTAMGVVTTLIFWGTETAFWLAWGTDVMREVGAVLGLVIGYFVKYNLDRRFVFRQTRAIRL